MYEDLKAKLKERCDLAKREFSSKDPELAKHDIFMKNCAKLFIGGEDTFKDIDSHFTGPGSLPIVVTGRHGCGKTRLGLVCLAQWLNTSDVRFS